MRTAIVVHRAVSAGEAANLAAILCGQLATIREGFFDTEPLLDRHNVRHAAVMRSIVILRADGAGQIANTAQTLEGRDSLTVLVFSRTGKNLNNEYESYREQISALSTLDTEPLGLLIAGPDEEVRKVTKKFSILM